MKDSKIISEAARVVEGSKTRYYTEIASHFEDSISFAIGEPDFITPQHIIEAAVQKLEAGETHYAPNPGIPELRDAIAEKYRKQFPQQNVQRENVIVTSGTQEANYLAMMTYLNPGDEIIIPEPCYISYIPQFKMLHAKPVYILSEESSGYDICASDIESAITEKTKAILLNTPCNPTGTVLSEKTLRAIVETARAHHIGIICDETYSDIVYEPFVSILDVAQIDDDIIYCSGFSKSYAMTGWRLGYAISTKDIATRMRNLHESIVSCSATALQYGAVEAIKNGADDIEMMRSEYEKRRNLICELLNEIKGVNYVLPKGAFYVFVNIKNTGLTSAEFTERLLYETHTVVAPGDIFGEAGEGYIRLSYATSPEKIKEGMKRLKKFIESL